MEAVGPVTFQFEALSDRVMHCAEQTHHWYDQIYSVFATMADYVRGLWRGRPKAFNWETAKLVVPGGRIGAAAVQGWDRFLREHRPDECPFSMVVAWGSPQASQGLVANRGSAREVADEAINHLGGMRDANLVFVPLIIGNGMLETAHIVWVTADREEERIEYFDPKGMGLDVDEEGNVLADKDEKHRLVAGVIIALMEREGISRVVQNPVRHQYDIHSCGVQGMRYMSVRRRNDRTFEQFILGGGPPIETVRQAMAKTLLVHPQDLGDGDSEALGDLSFEFE